jgi:magnesium-transporting ATPase (P-type)
MMNAQPSRVKLSALEQKLNNLVIVIVVTVVLVCVTLAIMSQTWNLNAQMQTQHYIKPYGYSTTTSGVLTFFRYFLLLNTMLPISLFVSLEVIKMC